MQSSLSKRLLLVVSASAVLAPQWASAGVDNDIPSCYAANKMPVPPPPPDLEVFVLVDQTTSLDAALQNSVRENLGRLIKPQTSFVIATFSEFGQGKYTQVLSAGALEGPIDKKLRDDISVKLLKGFDACLAGQLAFGRRLAAETLNTALAGQSSDLAKSDIMGSLKELSSRVGKSSAKDKIVLVVSDMLENSSVSTFYAKNAVRRVEPEAELEKAKSAKMIGDFAGARVFVLGAGLMQDIAAKNSASATYRDPRTMSALRQIWESYFAAGNARLVDFGAPALLSPVK